MTATSLRTRKDWISVALFGAIGASGLWGVIAHFVIAPKDVFNLSLSALMIFGSAPMLWVQLHQSLALTETELLIRAGPSRVVIPISTIRRVRRLETRKPPISRTVVEVAYGKFDNITVSPENHDAFIAALQARNPEITIG